LAGDLVLLNGRLTSGLSEERFPPVEDASPPEATRCTGCPMLQFLQDVWSSDEGQDIAEYAVMLAVILVLVIGTVRLIGLNANRAFSSVASDLQ
jgi:Flp pilus assembly pilin Flp